MSRPRQTPFGVTGEPTWSDRFGIWLSERRIGTLIGNPEGKRIGDFGCGYHGGIGRRFLGPAEHLVAVDLALSAELKSYPKVTAIEGRLPGALGRLDDACLDVIICNSVIEHLGKPQEAIAEFHRLLAPGGVCLINVPSWRGKWFLEFAAFRLGLSPAAEMDDHKAYYDPRDLWPLLVGAGFKPSRISCFRHKFGLNTFAVCRRDPDQHAA